MLIKIQPGATVCRYLFTAKLLYMFRVSKHPSSGVLKTVNAASGTSHNTGTATALQSGLIGTIRPRWRGVTVLILRYDPYRRLRLQFLVLLMMGALTPETCRVGFAVNKYLHTVASGWIFININFLFLIHEHLKNICILGLVILFLFSLKLKLSLRA